MAAKIYSTLIIIAVLFGLLVNSAYAKPAIGCMAIIFALMVISVCIAALWEEYRNGRQAKRKKIARP